MTNAGIISGMTVSRQVPGGTERAGRHAQRERTRRDLLAAAAELMAEGAAVTVPDVAERARVSRATAYRYYPNADVLVAELALKVAAGPLAEAARVGAERRDPVEHAGALARNMARWAFEHEAGLRAILRASLDPASGVTRPANRRRFLPEVLAPYEGRVAPDDLRRVTAALALTVGIDPIVCLRDVAGLDDDAIADVLEWTARTLVAAVAPADADGEG
jgi:AcrR family transcriptional regulator